MSTAKTLRPTTADLLTHGRDRGDLALGCNGSAMGLQHPLVAFLGQLKAVVLLRGL
jgi:hypothetical protein